MPFFYLFSTEYMVDAAFRKTVRIEIIECSVGCIAEVTLLIRVAKHTFAESPNATAIFNTTMPTANRFNVIPPFLKEEKEKEEILVPFRTWRNTNTGRAAAELSELFVYNVEGIEVFEPSHIDECCGFGGMFAVEEQAVSVCMGRDKVVSSPSTTAPLQV